MSKKVVGLILSCSILLGSCVPTDREGTTEGQPYHDQYFGLAIEGRLDREGEAIECSAPWAPNRFGVLDCPRFATRTNLGEIKDTYEGPLPIEPLIGAIAASCLQEFRLKGGVYAQCSWQTTDGTWQELNFTDPAAPPDLTYDNVFENFCAQQVLHCVGERLMELSSAVAPIPFEKTKPLDVKVTEVGTEDLPSVLFPTWLLVLVFDISYNSTDQVFNRAYCLLNDGKILIRDCDYTYLIPMQSALNNSLLLLGAASTFREASYRGMIQLGASAPVSSGDEWYEGIRTLVNESNSLLPDPTSLLDLMVTSHVESINAYSEAIEKLVKNQISVSASRSSENPDLATARDKEWNDEVNSRSAAVRILYEGEPPWIEGSTTHFSVIDVDPTASGIRDAITLVRNLGIYVPREGDVDVEDTAAKLAGAYYEDSCWLGDFTPNPDDLLARLEVSKEDLALALRYIQQEQFAFRRPEVPLPFSSEGMTFPCADTWPSHVERFGNVRQLPFNIPERLVAAEYSANAWDPDLVLEERRGLAYSANRAMTMLATKSLDGFNELASSDEASSDWAIQALSYVPTLSTAAQNAKVLAGNLLVNVVYDRLDPPVEYPDDWEQADSVRLHVSLFGDAPFTDDIGIAPGCLSSDGVVEDEVLVEKLLAVQPLNADDSSTAILQCMNTQFVEGEPCDIEDWATVIEVMPSNGCSGDHWGLWEGRRDYYIWLAFDRPAYLFRLAAGRPAELVGAWTARSIMGQAQMVYYGDWPVSRFALGGTMEEWVALSLRRDIKDAGKIDRGLFSPPLENELTSNGNEYEDSWRHYLELAKMSAAEADALGNEIIASGLEMDLRAEAALNELEEICGSVANVGYLQCDPADADATCPDLEGCNGDDVSGCAGKIYGGTGAQDGEINPSLSSCVPGGEKTRNVDFLALGGPLCFWLDIKDNNSFCGSKSLDVTAGEIPPCPILRAGGEGGDCATYYTSRLNFSGEGKVVILGDAYAMNDEDETMDAGVWLRDGVSEGGPWRLRFITLFEPEDDGDPELMPGTPSCELVRILHRKAGCFADLSAGQIAAARNPEGEYIDNPDECTASGGMWRDRTSPGWPHIETWTSFGVAHDQGWLSSDGLEEALGQIDLDADLAHHYKLEVNNNRVYSTRTRDLLYNNLDEILADPNGALALSSSDLSLEAERARIGHHLQDALVELGFMAGAVKGVGLGRPGIAHLDPVLYPDVVDSEYQANPTDLELSVYCSDPPNCPETGQLKVAKTADVESRFGGDCMGDESCKCLYLDWPPMDAEGGLIGPELVKAILSDVIFFQDWYSDSEHIPCVTALNFDVISVRDDCRLDLTPSDVSLGTIRNLFRSTDFWNLTLHRISSLSIDSPIPPYFGNIPASESSDFARYYHAWQEDGFKFKASEDSCKGQDGLPRPDSLLLMRMLDEEISNLQITSTVPIFGGVDPEEKPTVQWSGTSDRDTFFWALELACSANDTSEGSIECAEFDVNELAEENINHTSEVYLLTRHLQCAAEAFKQAGQRIILADVPEAVVETALTPAWEPQSQNFGGSVLQYVNGIEADLEEFNDTLKNVEFELTLAALDVEEFRGRVKEIDLNAEIAQLRSIQNMVSYAAAAVSSFSGDPVSWGTGPVATALYTYAILIEGEIMNKQEQLHDTEVNNEFNLLQTNMVLHLRNLKDYYVHMADTLRDIENNLESYNMLLRDAERQVAIATFQDSDSAGRVYNVNTTMRRRHNTLLERYAKRLDFAKKAATLAKKAIEFRTGIDLSTETQEMALVPAPSTWVGNLEKLQGIDYSRIRCVPVVPADEGGVGGNEVPDTGGADTGCMAVDDYAEEYIGDWVALLEGYMESYSSAHPFSDGEDYAVVSLRDDILKVKEFCQVETENLFYHSEDLSAFGEKLGPEAGSEGTAGWRVTGCPETVDPTSPVPACLTVQTFASTGSWDEVPCGYYQSDSGVWDIYFCRGKNSEIRDVSDPGVLSYDGMVTQVVGDLPRGTYLLSWFDREIATSEPPEHDYSYRIVIEIQGENEGEWEEAFSVVLHDAESWTSRRVLVRLSEMKDIRVGFDPSPIGTGPDAVALSAVSLTYIDDYYRWSQCCTGGDGSSPLNACSLSGCEEVLPMVFEPTGASRLLPGVCPDTDGSSLRQMFGQKCDYLCSDGFQETTCSATDPGAHAQWCYYEVPFHVALEELESGETFTSGAIALGNFNYRHVEVGVNIVGTNVVDCSMTDYPTTCYTNAFLEYSLRHGGTLEVRNHVGGDSSFYLPSAWIEHKKALNTETVLTNPATGTQRELLTDYMNGELWGRPMTGDYLLKIWDKDGLAWNHIEDIQVVFRYHYWTRHAE